MEDAGTGSLPPWIGYLGLIAAAGQLTLILPIIVDSSLFTDTGIVFAVAQLVFVVWLLSVSVAMLTRSAKAQISPTSEADAAPQSAAT